MTTLNIAFILLALLIGASTIPGGAAVEYIVTNNAATTPGGARFNTDIGDDYSRRTMEAATNFIWDIFQQTDPADRKNVEKVNLFIDDDALKPFIAYAMDNEIHAGASYINGISGDVRRDFDGVMYHEMTHIWQWSGPLWVIEGIADFVRLKADYAPSHWVGPGGGEKWNMGYDVTARFLDYCNDLKSGFVAELNLKMRNGYSDSFFQDILGKPVDVLWSDYKAKYNTP
ncbi:uncharacterized protein LOC127262464 [Andrographis paniculata]|uniref:uncharacterized protein LOC127262464 n=1 Tax=Andrographis paniculata TaxID=175694 RepID=UPI0021E85ADF|nr:uncharacterized protein LOC127262464 [Andrographis paniculata]